MYFLNMQYDTIKSQVHEIHLLSINMKFHISGMKSTSRPHIIYSVFSVVAANDPIFPSESLASFDIKKTKSNDVLSH